MDVSLKLTPGIDVEKTPLLNSASWSYSAAARFFEGMPQKVGGWTALNNSSPLIGICTGLHAWADLSSVPYIAAGTDQRLEIFYGGVVGDITPIRKSVNITPAFTTVINTKIVTVHDVAHGTVTGDWVDITIPVAVGGVIIQGFYQVTFVDADNYTIRVARQAATSTSGGAVPVFDTTATSANVKVTLAAHRLNPGDLFAVQVSTAIGGITITVGSYNVVSNTTNTFIIVPAGVAGSSATVSENGGDAHIDYLIASGLTSATFANNSGVYGGGLYGGGLYGGASQGGVIIPLRQWFLDNFGQDLVGNYTGSPLYVWTPPPAPGNVAIPIDTTNFPSATSPPQQVTVSFVSAPQQMIIALGCDDPISHIFDPLLVRWSDVSDFTDWVATSTNQAGSYRIPAGSRLVGGIRAPNFICLWTDIDMWLMSYLGGTALAGLVWGFSQVATGVDLLAARGVVVYRNIVFWVSSNGFFAYDGNSVQLLPCPVWDKFWFNLNRQQSDKISAQVNSYFQEISWAFPSASGDGTIDSRITFNIREGLWTYDDAPTLTARTAWIDDNVYGAPLGTDNAGLFQQHETSPDANGAALVSSVQSGWFATSEGSYLMMMERLFADFIATGGTRTVQITVYSQNYSSGPITTHGPFAFVAGSGPPWSIVRARGRFMSIKVGSSDLGVFWRLGNLRYDARQAGRRP